MKFDLTNCVAFITNTVLKSVNEEFDKQLLDKGLTRSQWIVLYFLINANKPIQQSELSQLINIKESSLVRLIDRMEKAELVERRHNKNDKRIRYIELTEYGKDKAVQSMPLGQEFSDALLYGISEEEIKIFYKVLDKITENKNSLSNRNLNKE